MMRKISSLIGQKFNKLTVIDFSHKTSDRKYYWKCVCDCGNTRIARSDQLKRGEANSCGCKKTTRYKDLTGMKFDRLKVIKLNRVSNRLVYWECLCDCGNSKITLAISLNTGGTRSCGCKNIKHGHNVAGKESITHVSWRSMLDRCSHVKENNYKYKNIKVCDRWGKFENFLEDMGERPGTKYSLDRINNEGDYELYNCRWAKPFTQIYNRSNTMFLEYDNTKYTLPEFCKFFNLSKNEVSYGLASGLTVDEIVEKAGGYSRNHLIAQANNIGDFFYKYFAKNPAPSVVSWDRQYVIYQIMNDIVFRGDIAECGTFKGGTAWIIANYLKENNIFKNFSVFDTFEGLPEVTSHDLHKKGDFDNTSIGEVQNTLKEFKDIEYHHGLFRDTFKNLPERKYSFVHVDCDLYEGYIDCLEYFYPRMLKGGIILGDDVLFPSCPGAKKAVTEFFADKKEDVIELKTNQAMVVKE